MKTQSNDVFDRVLLFLLVAVLITARETVLLLILPLSTHEAQALVTMLQTAPANVGMSCRNDLLCFVHINLRVASSPRRHPVWGVPGLPTSRASLMREAW